MKWVRNRFMVRVRVKVKVRVSVRVKVRDSGWGIVCRNKVLS